jgi:hypothetical protein
MLDYLCWISVQMLEVGAHSGTDKDSWRERVQKAYTALFFPPVAGRGDPYPPDVPPARNPGIWPDVPAGGIPGMTLRHQLVVIGMVSEQMRRDTWLNARPNEIAEWDRRTAIARQMLDHGASMPLPEDARTKPSTAAIEDAHARDRAIRDAVRKRIRRAEASLGSSRKAAKPKAEKPAPKAEKPEKAEKAEKPAKAEKKPAAPAKVAKPKAAAAAAGKAKKKR